MLRLLLADAFKITEPTVTLIKDFYRECPQLFSTLLPRSEKVQLNGSLPVDADDEDEEDVLADDAHQLPIVTGCIHPKYVRSELNLPTRMKEMEMSAHPRFGQALSLAYGEDYLWHATHHRVHWISAVMQEVQLL